ncbi:MAG: hypothetical protein R6V72_10350, partial [Cyclobacterium sp.]|uniref:hypothetical protein n=1 Tax=Cyclobacterium sp. TaxID=1966343 RepID=UPI003970DF49
VLLYNSLVKRQLVDHLKTAVFLGIFRLAINLVLLMLIVNNSFQPDFSQWLPNPSLRAPQSNLNRSVNISSSKKYSKIGIASGPRR